MGASGKQAVLVIHGVGEQRPMATLRGFVDAVWTRDDSLRDRYGIDTVWSKPDTVSGSYELRRLTTGKNARGVRTDFFELYWAHRMEGTSWGHVAAWAQTLLRRWPWNLPSHLRPAWAVLVLLVLVVLFFAANAALPQDDRIVAWPWWASVATSAFVALVAGPVMLKIVGDAARYLNATPANIARRQEIRTQGIEILQKLHDSGYDRIVVVGHSLGAVIGYDILTHAWALHNEARKVKGGRNYAALHTLEEQAASNVRALKADSPATEAKAKRETEASERVEKEAKPLDLDTWRYGQRLYFDELRKIGCTWRVTDFVTAGSPLVHAEALLASSADDLRRRRESRELPTCPPLLEGELFSYPRENKNRTPHHGAVFGPTRWTNLYFPARFLVRGDFVGGPAAPIFGPGVKDVEVETKRWFGWLSHTFYWDPDGRDMHIAALQDAVDLLSIRDRMVPTATPTANESAGPGTTREEPA